jgi:hypothetical protein
MNTIIKKLEKNIKKVKRNGKGAKKAENGIFNFSMHWPIKTI